MSTPVSRWVLLSLRSVGVILFGILLPIACMLQAYRGMDHLQDLMRSTSGFPLMHELRATLPSLKNVDDYRLASQVLGESASQRTMINKQAMKMVAMFLGFAISSLGIMLIMLGIRGDITGNAQGPGFSLDLQRVSIGAAVFIVGAALTSAAALLSNKYVTVQSPVFGPWPGTETAGDGKVRAEGDHEKCRHAPEHLYQQCMKETADET